jgi:hypothetical protein
VLFGVGVLRPTVGQGTTDVFAHGIKLFRLAANE